MNKEQERIRNVVVLVGLILGLLCVVLGTIWSGLTFAELSVLDWVIRVSLWFAVTVALVTYIIIAPNERSWSSNVAFENALEYLITSAAIISTVLTCIGSTIYCPKPILHVICLALFFLVFPIWEVLLAQQLRKGRRLLRQNNSEGNPTSAKLSTLNVKLGALGEMFFFVDVPVALSFSCFAVITGLLYLSGVLCEAQVHILIAGAAALHLFSSSTAFVAVNSDLLIGNNLGDYFKSEQNENPEEES